MKLDQFDRLQNLVRQSSEVILKLKFENKNLMKKFTEMQRELATKSEKTTQKLQKLEEENKFLRQRQEKVSSRLMHLKNKVRGLSEGVES